MTNAQIILSESCRLMDEGIIGSTGRTITVELADGSEAEIMEPEAIHTYNGWKARGYQVKRGEHRIAEFLIWKAAAARRDAAEEDDERDPERIKMFMKRAFFFKVSQCERIAG